MSRVDACWCLFHTCFGDPPHETNEHLPRWKPKHFLEILKASSKLSTSLTYSRLIWLVFAGVVGIQTPTTGQFEKQIVKPTTINRCVKRYGVIVCSTECVRSLPVGQNTHHMEIPNVFQEVFVHTKLRLFWNTTCKLVNLFLAYQATVFWSCASDGGCSQPTCPASLRWQSEQTRPSFRLFWAQVNAT